MTDPTPQARPGHYPGCTREAGHGGPCEPNAYTPQARPVEQDVPNVGGWHGLGFGYQDGDGLTVRRD